MGKSTINGHFQLQTVSSPEGINHFRGYGKNNLCRSLSGRATTMGCPILPFESQADVKKTAAKAQPKVPPTRRVTWKMVNLTGTCLKVWTSILWHICCGHFLDLFDCNEQKWLDKTGIHFINRPDCGVLICVNPSYDLDTDCRKKCGWTFPQH